MNGSNSRTIAPVNEQIPAIKIKSFQSQDRAKPTVRSAFFISSVFACRAQIFSHNRERKKGKLGESTGHEQNKKIRS